MKYNNFNFKNITSINYELIDNECLNRLVEKVTDTLESIGINSNNLKILYQRISSNNSIIAIKVINGKDNLENYVYCECKTDKCGNSILCNVVFHNDINNEIATKLSSKISRNLINFFEQNEKSLYSKNKDAVFTYEIPLKQKEIIEDDIEERYTETKQKKKSLVKTLFKK